MREKMLLLERRIEDDLETISEIYRDLGETAFDERASDEATIVAGYRLHNLYNAIENIFRNIAEAFENNLEDRERWHSELLQRMTLDLRPVRPAAIDDQAFDRIDELRRFRHLFRSAYGVRLDPERLSLVFRKAMELRQLFPAQIESFLVFVREVATRDDKS